ncbi:hypothetical protein KIPB_005096 [Kipferlia bialata]|uniref:Uncharacterized protein n=1 Tax=Kipferlia bialata TaxID=797122 RepID=A0A9K3CUV0_9EUKA|nr:hypothetical protein KIPB_005096 [Kipferlia bialata]|eukprot:g5096.t1
MAGHRFAYKQIVRIPDRLKKSTSIRARGSVPLIVEVHPDCRELQDIFQRETGGCYQHIIDNPRTHTVESYLHLLLENILADVPECRGLLLMHEDRQLHPSMSMEGVYSQCKDPEDGWVYLRLMDYDT